MTHVFNTLLSVTVGLAAVGAAAQITSHRVIPIPNQLFAQPVPGFIGSPATPQVIATTPVPQSPYMAPNGRSELHTDDYQSDTYPFAGPLGHSPQANSTFLAAECGTVTFDARGRIIVVCIGIVRPVVYLMDPDSLETLATYNLPARGGVSGNFGSGGYFFLDNQDRAVIPTRGRDIYWIKENAQGMQFALDHTCKNNLPGMIPADQAINSVIPDDHGLLWFTTSGGSDLAAEPAMVGTVHPDPSDMNSCTVKLFTLPAGEQIVKSLGADPDPSRGGVFIVSTYQMYRFDPAADGTPTVTWHEAYDRGTGIKPGQRYQGSGTTPTLVGTDFVTINDNADVQTHVLVYRRGAQTSEPRLVCAVPVFQPGKSDSFNSLIATDKSILIENNWGYVDLSSTVFGRTTEPGIARVDLSDDRNSCSAVWTNTEESVPNVVSQASLATGLVYTYSKDPSPADARYTAPWYFTAVDFKTGETVFKVLAGTGVFYNSNYSGVYLGPDGKTGYVGVVGGLVRIHDTY
jgi:hypothetical protein